MEGYWTAVGKQAMMAIMSKRLRMRLGFTAVAVIALAIPLAVYGSAVQEPGELSPTSYVDDSSAVWAADTLSDMSLEQKVGQLFVHYAYGESAETTVPGDVSRNQKLHGVDNAAQLLDQYQLGGMIYFTWSNNLNRPVAISELSNGLQQSALDHEGGVPLLISTDQEHGIVDRMPIPATQLPGGMALAAARDPQNALTAAEIAGSELAAVGINQNFAPVADVNVNPANPVIGVRSFSSDPGLASEYVTAQVDGYQYEDGVTATAKHFPGHGNTDVDSHTGLPVIPHTRAEWEAIDRPPFEVAIEAGIDSIMSAHIKFPALDDSGVPATLSKPILTGLLREELGFDGLIVTDSLSMAGVADHFPPEDVPVMALQAGADVLLMPPNLGVAVNAVIAAVESGELTEERIDESVLRILELKHKRGIVDDPFVDPGQVDQIVGTPEHLAAAQSITDATATLVKNDNQILPLSPDTQSVLVTGWGDSTTKQLAERITEQGSPATALATGENPNQAKIDAAVAQAKSHEVTVVTTQAATNPKRAGQVALVKALIDSGQPVVVLAVGTPYDIAAFDEAGTYLATYSHTNVELASAARVMFNVVEPEGKLPVMIPTADDPDVPLYELGHGIGY